MTGPACNACNETLVFDGTTHHCRPDSAPDPTPGSWHALCDALVADGQCDEDDAPTLASFFWQWLEDNRAELPAGELATALARASGAEAAAETLRARVGGLEDDLDHSDRIRQIVGGERDDLRARLAAVEAERDNLRLQAQGWAQEARTQRATVREAYQAVTGATGEPGDWHGAAPVEAAIKRLGAEAAAGRALADEACALMSLDVALNHGKHSDGRWQRLGSAWRAYDAATAPATTAGEGVADKPEHPRRWPYGVAS